MSDKALRSSLIRLAYANPDLRPQILPILKEGAWDDGLPRVRKNLGDMIREAMELESAANELGRSWGRVVPKDAPNPDNLIREIGELSKKVQDFRTEVAPWYKAMELAGQLARTMDGTMEVPAEWIPRLMTPAGRAWVREQIEAYKAELDRGGDRDPDDYEAETKIMDLENAMHHLR